MPLSHKGTGYVLLNVLRVLNIICFMAVIVASIVSLVKIRMTNQFFFFEAVTHVITASISMFLIVTELNVFRAYFNRHWPLLGPEHGFVALGLGMAALGVNILANLNKPNMSTKELGLAFWRMVIGAGILVFIFGVLNIIASYVFRDRKAGVTARMVRAKGAVAALELKDGHKSYALSSHGSSRSTTFHSPTSKKSNPFTPRIKTPDTSSRSPIKFPQFGRQPTLPQYQTGTGPRPSSSHYSPQQEKPVREMVISGPIGINPQFAHLNLVRPDSAYHPSRREDV